jgi:rod shape determining protein RodA
VTSTVRTLAPYPAPQQGRIRNPLRQLRRLDWLLLWAALALSGFGSLLVWSATRARQVSVGGDPHAFLYRHLLNLAIGLVLCGVVLRFDYRTLRAYGPVVYVLSVLGLLLVLTPLGRTINGSHSWIVVAGLSLQPSELAKVGLCVGLALLLTDCRAAAKGFRHIEVPRALALASVPIGLVILQPDLGSAMVLVAIVTGVLVVAAVPWRWLLGLAAAAAAGAIVVVQLGLLSQYQVNRFAAFVDPALDPRGVGYNANQARIAIGSGGLLGKGLFHGTQTDGQFVPEQHTDFIFTVAGEELGLVGAGLTLAFFGLLLWRACLITRRTDDLFGALMATGVICWFAFQTFENVGMTLGIMPITGLPLPFLSYGGSAMFANFTAVGLLENVHVRSHAVSAP